MRSLGSVVYKDVRVFRVVEDSVAPTHHES